MKCKYCESELKPGAKFCPYCGKEVLEFDVCINCGKQIKVGASFCPHCGKNQHEVNIEPEPIESEPSDEVVENIEQPYKEVVNQQVPQDISTPEPQEEVLADTIEPYAENQSSKKWVFIIVAVLLVGILGGGGYYFMSNKSESSFIVQEMDSIADIKDSISTVDEISEKEESAKNNEDEESIIKEKTEFIEEMYKNFFGNNNFDTQNVANLKKYLTPDVIERIYMECPYDGCEGEKEYVVYVFYDGSLSYERPDVTISKREINNIDNNWFEIVGVDEYTKDQIKVQLEVLMGDNGYRVTNFKVQDY